MRSIDLIIAACVLAAGIATTFYSYNEIRKVEAPSVTFLDDYLRQGQNNYTLMSDQRCVGEINFSLDDSESTTIIGSSVLRVSVDKLIADALLTFHGIFNPLKQFAGGEALLKFNDIEIKLVAEGTNPIQLNVNQKAFETGKKFQYPLRGPIMLTQREDKSYGIDYPFLAQLSPALSHPSLTQLKSSLGLTVVRAEDLHGQCKEGALSRLDLTGTIKAIESFSSIFGNLK